jgi:2'-5' RNA ligase
MPHIPVVYPFVPNDDFPRAATILGPVLRNIKPFTVTLSRVSSYTSKTGSTVFAVPETNPPNAIKELQRAIETVLPEYNELVLKNESGFAPHLTLGQYDKEGIEETVAKLQAQWQPIDWEVKELYMVSRNGDVPFEVRQALQLGGEAPTKEYEENPQVFRPRDRRKDNSSNRFKLFVSNLSWNVDSQSLLDMFKDHRAKKGYVIMDKIRDRSRGYGFVEFESEADQQAALQAMQGREMDGRQILVKIAVENRSAEGGAPQQQGGQQ